MSARVPVGRRVPCSVWNTFCFSVNRGLLGLDLFLDLFLDLGLDLGIGGGAYRGPFVEVLRFDEVKEEDEFDAASWCLAGTVEHIGRKQGCALVLAIPSL